jgi:hypothetical protein
MPSSADRNVLSKLALPENIRCSNRCAKPVLPGFSFFEPTWYHVLTATTGALWSSCTSTVRPFFSTNFVYGMSGMGMSTPASRAGGAATVVPDSASIDMNSKR